MDPTSGIEIGLSAWIIQDGNYPEFELGKEYRFALEVGVDTLINSSEISKSMTRASEARYDFTGEILMQDSEFTVFDMGLLCYREGDFSGGFNPGQFVSGNIYLGVDPFFWFESHAQRLNVPNLFYRWHVKEILLETTEWKVTQDSRGRTCRSRVDSPTSFTPVQQTRAWDDNGGNAHYILHCDCLGPA